MSEKDDKPSGAVETAKRLATALDDAGCQYALGGAIALGFWATPRGTLDVDVTLFLPPDQPAQCVALLQQIGCAVNADEATQSLIDYGYCHAQLDDRRVDVFLPILPFYEQARQRRKRVLLDGQEVFIWDAETLSVFKMMILRRKDVADVEQILRFGAELFDRDWVYEQLLAIFGPNDPRLSQWQELLRDVE